MQFTVLLYILLIVFPITFAFEFDLCPTATSDFVFVTETITEWSGKHYYYYMILRNDPSNTIVKSPPNKASFEYSRRSLVWTEEPNSVKCPCGRFYVTVKGETKYYLSLDRDSNKCSYHLALSIYDNYFNSDRGENEYTCFDMTEDGFLRFFGDCSTSGYALTTDRGTTIRPTFSSSCKGNQEFTEFDWFKACPK
eukprot:TRINITY_DN3383_c1_g1_i1.p1 TRINITY_DN3383_c1_g1~~TRINITY_DN3383_c1_g1_i1.p1  ORF type:complete len:195 (-),score=9.17 TRINITY_DN3383_c1_g1_i1:82-666(-)